jgi:hypothetical protein
MCLILISLTTAVIDYDVFQIVGKIRQFLQFHMAELANVMQFRRLARWKSRLFWQLGCRRQLCQTPFLTCANYTNYFSTDIRGMGDQNVTLWKQFP